MLSLSRVHKNLSLRLVGMESSRKRKYEEDMDLEPLDWELKREKDVREGKRRATGLDPEARAKEVRVRSRQYPQLTCRKNCCA